MRVEGFSVVVFAFHEAENVPTVLREIHAWLRSKGEQHELIFVDDGSTDGTLAAAREVLAGDPRATAFSLGANRGIGGALKAGVASATQPWVTFLPCDGQIPPEELDVLLAEAERSDSDVVFSVYRDRDDGLLRKVFSAGVRGMIRAVHGVTMRSDGPYLFRRELFSARELVPDTFFLNFEFPIRAMQRRVRSSVVTIECVPRRAGQSKSAGWRTVYRVGRDLLDLKRRQLRGR
ncbi:MAG: glycosyltransferase family 2 protein [Myxococcaceae bacterium]|nr:MAG: glycosyltransferase family 2 protein [Myxococcaceae bacterium]